MIIGHHVLETECELQMGENGSQIDARLFPENQTSFLAGLVKGQDATWTKLFEEKRIVSGIRTQKMSQLDFLRSLWPKAFDTATPAGEHLDPWWFRVRNEWNGTPQNEIDHAISHTLEVHFGMHMDRAKRSIDPRLSSDGAKDYLAAQGCKDWSDLAEKAKLFPMVNCVPAYKMSLILALRSIYSWAFDLTTSEGKHLHFWQLFPHGSTLWSDKKDVIAAVRHETLVHDNIEIKDIPHKCGINWLRSKGLIALMHQYTLLELINLCFIDEIAKGQIKIEDLDYITDNYKTMDPRERVMIENIRYCFPKELNSLLAKRIDKETIGLFEAKDDGDLRVFVLKYKLDLAKLNTEKKWHNLEMSDLVPA
ncbi:hypothetical protein HZC34_04920 [Candidatus Saganbacteria bacterium]|nr:hypothetical protein [Candidatus Saganbacteria bacterium]